MASFLKNRHFQKFSPQICFILKPKLLKSEAKIFKKMKKLFFLKITSNIHRMLEMCPRSLPDIQKVTRTHVWYDKMILNTFSKIEFRTHISNFWLRQLWTSLKNSIFMGLFQVWGQSQYHFSKVTTIVEDSLRIA